MYELLFLAGVLFSTAKGDVTLEGICQTTFGVAKYGDLCNPYLPQCEVCPWSEWSQSASSLITDGTCPSGSRGVLVRSRFVGFPGRNCPPLNETRTDLNCLSETTAKAVNAIRLADAIDANVNPAAALTLPPPRPEIANIVKELKSLRDATGSTSTTKSCTCPCADATPSSTRDLVVVFDTSGSVAVSDFNQAVNSLVLLLKNECELSSACIGKDIMRLALVSFSNVPRVVVDFATFARDYQDVSKLDSLIRSIPYIGKSTATGIALQKVKNEILQTSAGMRPSSNKTILILTDGKSNTGVSPVSVSQSIAAAYPGIKIIGVGIGQGINAQELQDITHHPRGNGNILVYGFQDFVEIIEAIVRAPEGCPDAYLIYDKRK